MPVVRVSMYDGRNIDQKRELVKVRLLDTVDGDRKDVAKDLAARSDVELVQVLGRTVLLYRRNEENPGIQLPK